jgi:polygalacturonase
VKTAFFLALITLIPALSKAAVAQTVYYVEPAGKNTNPGTEDRPWQTIQHAANRLLAGDSVYIRAGVYKERIIPKNSGAPGSYIAYSAYHGEKVTIDGAGIILPENWGGLFHIYGRTHIKVAGLHIINAGPHDNNAGILVDGSSHIILKNNYTYNTVSSGIGAWNSHDIIIDGNEIELACNDGEQESLTVAVTDRFVVRNNHVHHGGPGSTGGEGIDIKDGSSNGLVYNNYVHDMNRLGIYVDAWDKHTHNIEVFRNRVHDCDDRGIAVASESGGLLENITVHNIVVYNNRLCGFESNAYVCNQIPPNACVWLVDHGHAVHHCRQQSSGYPQ